jgi:hypothetical protein
MATTDKGAIAAASLFCADGSISPFNIANARVGVGDSTTAFVVSQTDLQASTNKLRKVLDSAPVRTNNSVDFTASFNLSEANFAWNEIGLFNSSSGDYMATRRTLTGFGTKANTEQWTVTVTLIVTPA